MIAVTMRMEKMTFGYTDLIDEDACDHNSNEDCMYCAVCGKCSESLDADDLCYDCRCD